MDPAKEACAAKGIAWIIPLYCPKCAEIDVKHFEVHGMHWLCAICGSEFARRADGGTVKIR